MPRLNILFSPLRGSAYLLTSKIVGPLTEQNNTVGRTRRNATQ